MNATVPTARLVPSSQMPRAVADVSGTTDIDAGGALAVTATNNVAATGAGLAEFGNLGAGVSVVKVDQTTSAQRRQRRR